MSHILVVSDNEILNQLYVTNLEVYLGAKVTLVKSVAKAFDQLKVSTFDLLITTNMINGQDSAIEIYTHVENHKYKGVFNARQLLIAPTKGINRGCR